MAKPEPVPVAAAYTSRSRFGLAIRRFRSNPLALLGTFLLAGLLLVAIFGPMLWHYGFTEITPDLSQPPSWLHPLGTDTLGRDMLALVMRGMQQSLLIAGTVALIATVIGTLVGVMSGYFGGLVDASLMRLVDLVLTIPTIALAAFLGNTMSNSGVSWLGLSLVLGALFWTSVARLVRGVSLSLRELPYIKASRVMGAGHARIMLRHMIPNVADHIIVATALLVGVAILSETGLSFLGFGVRPPDTSLGLLIANAQTAVLTRPWMFYAPGLLIIMIVLSINYVGEGLRDAFNPKANPTNPLIEHRARYKAETNVPAPPANGLVNLTSFSVRFPGADRPAVDNVDLSIARGEVLALVGESGSGKSLTSLALAGLLPIGAMQSGRVSFDGQDMGGLDFQHWRAFRGRRIATILQDPSTSLNPVLTIGAQFEESFRIAGDISTAEARRRAIELMTLMAIRDPQSRLEQYPHQMSGGIRQRIVIAMAMIHNPDLIIADEPTTALDVTVQAQVLDALRIAREKTNAAMLFITHDLALVAGIADRVAVMRAGRIVEQQDVFSLFSAPRDPYTTRLLSLAPRLGEAVTTNPAQPVSTSAQPLLTVENLSRQFLRPRSRTIKGGDRVVHALRNVSFDLNAGETLGIVGESGSGKTTMLSTILGLHKPTAGRVLFEGVDLGRASPAARRAASRSMSVVFQDPYTSLDPRMTVRDLLLEPAQIHGATSDVETRARAMLDRVRLPMASLDRYPHEFSGGQRQRIAIARSLMLDPKLVVLDEPVSALDVSIQQDIIALLGELKRDFGVAYLLVAHDLAIVAELSDRIGVMLGGEMVELGTAEQVVHRPIHAYTRSLLDAVPIPDPVIERDRLARRAAELISA
ncbi:dipeptide ABC transporter ATP-binding protein [Devosia ginsengisoli]|uniref:ABC transporter ATP-binding protein/permease n=1 Tax=Devosia ginsengisoli TaxID=400770 RepID=UPI0026F29634|nr:dipeptide ABC transporter ATP-binding protein [Devosia ginsengisoli]MCR6672097.1 dipeptide ABC transporter ATP-binding protein [Devosia ginsengisoli]